MQPDDLAMLQRVFKAISAEPWFTQDPEMMQRFGAFLIRAYQNGVVDFSNLHDLALRTACERFKNVSSQMGKPAPAAREGCRRAGAGESRSGVLTSL